MEDRCNLLWICHRSHLCLSLSSPPRRIAIPQRIGIRYLSLCPFQHVSVALSDACGRVDLHRQPVDNCARENSTPSGHPTRKGRNARDDSDQHEGRQNTQPGRHQQPDRDRRRGLGQRAAGMVIQLTDGCLDTRQRR